MSAYFLKLDGIPGESTDAKHKDEIELVAFSWGVAEVGSNVAGIFVHLMPVFGALLAWMFLHEQIRLFHVAGIALILAGITLTTRRGRAVPEPGPE